MPAKILLNLAWAAGLFDGEGAFFFQRSKNRNGRSYGGPTASIAQTDARVLRRFRRAVGCGKVYGPYTYRNGKLTYWSYQASRCADALIVARRLYRFLSPVKRAQIRSVRRQFQAYKERPRWKSGPKPKGQYPHV